MASCLSDVPQGPWVMCPKLFSLLYSIIFSSETKLIQGKPIEYQAHDQISSIQPWKLSSSEGDFTYAHRVARLVSSVGFKPLFLSIGNH